MQFLVDILRMLENIQALYTQKLQKLIYLYLSTDSFMRISLQLKGQTLHT